ARRVWAPARPTDGVPAAVDLDHLQDANPVRAGDPRLSDVPGRCGGRRPGQPRRSVCVRDRGLAAGAGGGRDLVDSAVAESPGRGPEAASDAGPGVFNGSDGAGDLRVRISRGRRASAPELDAGAAADDDALGPRPGSACPEVPLPPLDWRRLGG